MEARQQKILFSQIIQGFSHYISDTFGNIFIKHFTPLDSADVDFVYSSFYKKAIKDGLITLEESEKNITESGQWTKQNELDEQKKFLNSAVDSRSKLYLKSKRDIYNKTIEDTEKKIKELELEKFKLIGQTADYFAIKKSNENYIELSFYKDKELNNRLFTYEEFDELNNNEINDITSVFNKYNQDFSQNKIKMLGMSPFFLNMFNLCPENAMDFYGKPLIHLTFHQIDLWGTGKYMKSVISNWGSKIPPSVMNDADKLNEWIEIQSNYREFENKQGDGEGGATSVVGATKSDLEYLGLNQNVVDFKAMAKAKGKTTLTKEDLIGIS